MPPSARACQLSIAALALAACSSKPHDPPATGSAEAVEVAPPPAPPSVVSDGGIISLTFHKIRPKGSALGKRCTIAGDPLAASCSGGGDGLAIDKAGTLWVVAGDQVRRLRRTADCTYEPAGEPVALPPENQRPQPLGKGPVYMRSGGPAWHLVAGGDAVYAFDYLGGMFRIDHGKAEPACEDVFGYDSAAYFKGKLLIARKGIEELALGKKCIAKPTTLVDGAGSASAGSGAEGRRGSIDKQRGKLFVMHDKLYLATRDNKLQEVGGAEAATDKLCSISAAFACGPNVCAIDTNCRAVVQSDPPRKLESDTLFEPVPWTIPEAVTLADGTGVVLARVREGMGSDATCEGALYELPSAIFTR